VPVRSGTILELLLPVECWVDFNDMSLFRLGKVRDSCVENDPYQLTNRLYFLKISRS
jgi:hypothetical protein